MKQAFLYKGKVNTLDVPKPQNPPKGFIVVRLAYSCVSAGTEMSGVAHSGLKLYQRALQKPQLVFQTLKIGRTRGLSVMQNMIKTSQGSGVGTPLGYSAVGYVSELYDGCNTFKIGQSVAVAGNKYAFHAEYVCVPENLIVPVDDRANLSDSSTVAIGSIAMQGIRRLSPQAGDCVVVMGLGLIGQITSQILANMGCDVIGIDISAERAKMAQNSCKGTFLGESNEDTVKKVMLLTDGKGVDGVIFTAATSSDKPMAMCFRMLRRKGRFVLVGVSGMNINRDDIYAKEIDFCIATSYGPGRYDPIFEEGGIDYPHDYVPYTERDNMRVYLDELAQGKITLSGLSRKEYKIEDAGKAYEGLSMQPAPMITILSYSQRAEINPLSRAEKEDSKVYVNPSFSVKDSAIKYAVVGTGSYMRGMHMPNLAALGDKIQLVAVMNHSVAGAAAVATQYGAEYYTTDYQDILADDRISLVFITTRHDSHAKYVIHALKAGKNVFVEKPLAVTREELDKIRAIAEKSKSFLMVGYNRRFSEYAVEIKKHLDKRNSPVFIDYMMNAGYIPDDSWIQDPKNGKRIIGEACHIIDLFLYLTGSHIKSVSTNKARFKHRYYKSDDNLTAVFEFEDGSICNLHYVANGSNNYPKETADIYFDDKHINLNDYCELTGDVSGLKRIKSEMPDKGQMDILKKVLRALKNGETLISIEELAEVSRATFDIQEDV